jgi:nitrite reductase/ring-hydroxylating ferredoxin subunit
MTVKFSSAISAIALIFSLLILSSCREREETVRCFPDVPVNVILNLTLPAYYELQNVNGWIYVNEQQAGTRGLIVVRTTNGFKIYDRNAPHLCPGNDTTLQVENGIRIVCPQDGAEWILITGEPIKNAQISPKTYRYNLDPSGILTIFN